ncbi:MAG: hypothetical protein HFE90_03220 [Firmicutes bacterium]|nr:hypothetical protein [Bacillota bacterium]
MSGINFNPNASAYSAANYKAGISKNASKTDSATDNNTAAVAENAAKTDTFQSSAGAVNSAEKVAKGDSFEIDVNSLIEQNNKRIADFTSQIMSMVTKQGEKSNLTLNGLNLTVTAEDAAKAKAAISEGGEWSVNAVADRIMNMAYALSGGDESKLSTLKDAVMKGFEQAGFDPKNRSTMPEITGKTYDEILKRFDDWEKNGMKTYENTDLENAKKAAKSKSIDVEA